MERITLLKINKIEIYSFVNKMEAQATNNVMHSILETNHVSRRRNISIANKVYNIFVNRNVINECQF